MRDRELQRWLRGLRRERSQWLRGHARDQQRELRKLRRGVQQRSRFHELRERRLRTDLQQRLGQL